MPSPVKPTFRERYGYPLWYPWAGVLVFLSGVFSFGAVFYTMNIRWFLVTLVAVIIMGAFVRR